MLQRQEMFMHGCLFDKPWQKLCKTVNWSKDVCPHFIKAFLAAGGGYDNTKLTEDNQYALKIKQKLSF